jgi:hypothetical protein
MPSTAYNPPHTQDTQRHRQKRVNTYSSIDTTYDCESIFSTSGPVGLFHLQQPGSIRNRSDWRLSIQACFAIVFNGKDDIKARLVILCWVS